MVRSFQTKRALMCKLQEQHKTDVLKHVLRSAMNASHIVIRKFFNIVI